MTQPIPATPWQAELPTSIPLHCRRNIEPGPDGCWLWTRSRSRDGYGWASVKHKTHQAHRLIYRLVVGEPPAGTVLDHLCRVRHCVNPAHMEPVTARENLARGETTTSRERCAACGGEFSIVGKMKPQRRCLDCARNWRREYAREYRRGLRRRAVA